MNDSEAALPISLPRSTDFDADPATFSAPAWLNHVLSAPTNPELPALLDTLNESLRESHEALDTALNDALKVVPWVVRESERVRQRANALRSNVDSVGKRVANVETGVVSSVKTIADADTVVRRVQETVALLETASNADILLERLESLLASAGADGADLVAAADVVSQLRKALHPLHGISEMKDRFAHLERADARLEKLAAPQLLKALESHNRKAAFNARIVFDHAGRENAFRAQYVNLRSIQVRNLWSSAWTSVQTADTPPDVQEDVDAISSRLTPNSSEAPSKSSKSTLGDLASDAAETALVTFYDQLAQLLSTEVEWLQDAFPDVKTLLLPSLVCDSLADLKDPLPRVITYVPPMVPDPVSVTTKINTNLSNAALCSVASASKIGKIFLPDSFLSSEGSPDNANASDANLQEEKAQDSKTTEQVFEVVSDALTSLLMPFRKYWESVVQTTVRQARARAESINLICDAKPSGGGHGARKSFASLTDIARDVETCHKEACSILDECLTVANTQSCGVGISAMKQTSSAISAVVSERLYKVVRSPARDSAEDEWTRLNGALRLLVATAALKRGWDGRKESAFAVAIGTATPVLEVASLVQEDAEKRVRQFLAHVESNNLSEAGIVWELVRDESLSQKVVTEYESLDSSNDFGSLLESVHRVVYGTLLRGIEDRFSSFNSRDLLGEESMDGDAGMAGFSSSPLRYATEVADYLMTIPQQLEPFVPDEEDAKFASPKCVYAFSKSRSMEKRVVNVENEGGEDVGAEEGSISFAGMWISVLAIGTMEMYVEKICNLSKLSEGGTQQLATDADYVCNVMASLGVGPTAEMALVCRLLECKKDSASFSEAAASYTSAEHRKLVRRVAAVRGISVTL